MVIVLQLLRLNNLNDIHEHIVCLHIDSGVEGCIDILQNRLTVYCVVLGVEETAQCCSCHRSEWECFLLC